MNAIVIYESLTGNTRKAAQLIARHLTDAGVPTTICPTTQIDYQALSAADVVIVGSWTDGVVFFGQRPGRAGRLRSLPVLHGKKAVVYCTYAIDPGATIDKLTRIVQDRGAEVLGGMAIRRDKIIPMTRELVDRLLENVPA